jgi:hypothetical protein
VAIPNQQPLKNKNQNSDFWAGLFLPRQREFETKLTPHECYERLTKLPQRMTYLNAKHQVERVNSENNIEVKWLVDENRVEFGLTPTNRTRSTEFVILGEVFYSDIYETTLVKGWQKALFPAKRLPFLYNEADESVNTTLAVIYLCLFVLFFTLLWIGLGFAVTANEHHLLCIATSFWIPVVAIFGFVILPVFGDTGRRSRWRLIKLVLTEPDETKL